MDSLFSDPSARADSVGETPTNAAETAALPISTESLRLSGIGETQPFQKLRTAREPLGVRRSGNAFWMRRHFVPVEKREGTASH